MPTPQSSILSALLNANSESGAQSLVEVILSIQTQLSEIQENQRIIIKSLRKLRTEQEKRIFDLKKTTQALIKKNHTDITDQLSELQSQVDDPIDDLDSGEFYDLSDSNLF